MTNYYVGEKLYIDPRNEPNKGIPVIDSDGQEIYVLPEEFDYLGRPEADIMHSKPEDLDERGEQ